MVQPHHHEGLLGRLFSVPHQCNNRHNSSKESISRITQRYTDKFNVFLTCFCQAHLYHFRILPEIWPIHDFLKKKVLVLLTILRDDYYFNLQPSLLLSHTIENSHKACSKKISPPFRDLHSSIYLWNTTSKVAGLLTEISSEAAQRWYFSTCKFHWQSALSDNP